MLNVSPPMTKYERTNVVLSFDEARTKRELKARAKQAFRGIYQADLTDDGKHIQLHWAPGEMTTLSFQDMLDAYLRELGARDEPGSK